MRSALEIGVPTPVVKTRFHETIIDLVVLRINYQPAIALHASPSSYLHHALGWRCSSSQRSSSVRLTLTLRPILIEGISPSATSS